jgi:inositol phosphorylceramide mannosyltransferase catalytic subunit
MRLDGVRARRVIGALTNPTSYRLLFACFSNRLAPIPDVVSDLRGHFGTPDVGSSGGEKIPRIVFQTWKSRSEMPANYRYWRSSFIINNPEFRCFLWDDADNLRFIEERFPWFLSRYRSYPREILRADVIRLFFLYEFGGFYSDMDSECLRPLETMREMGDVLVGRMGKDPGYEHSIPNAIMATKPKQIFWLLAISFAVDRLAQSKLNEVRPEWFTGPILLKDAVDFYMDHTTQEILDRISKFCPELAGDVEKSDFGKIIILPPAVWYPVNWSDFLQSCFRNKMFRDKRVLSQVEARRMFPSAYIVTYWTASWK